MNTGRRPEVRRLTAADHKTKREDEKMIGDNFAGVRRLTLAESSTNNPQRSKQAISMNMTRTTKLAGIFLLGALTFSVSGLAAEDVNPADFDNIGDAFLAQSIIEMEKQQAAGNEQGTLFEYDALKAYNIFTNSTKETLQAATAEMEKLVPPPGVPYFWKSQPPEDFPFPLSKDFEGVIVTSRGRREAEGETTFPSWASDGNLYSTAADSKLLVDIREGPLWERIPDPEHSREGFYSPKPTQDEHIVTAQVPARSGRAPERIGSSQSHPHEG